MKICIKCNAEKSKMDFHKEKNRKDGLCCYCKSCRNEQARKWYEANPEKAADKGKKWRESNPEYSAESARKWREENPDKFVDSSRKWRAENSEKIAEKNRKWQAENKEKAAEGKRKYREENHEKIAEINRKWRESNTGYSAEISKKWREENPDRASKAGKIYRKMRLESDPLFKLSINIRTLIGKSIKNQGYTKKSKTFEILGCTFEEFKMHIESQFQEGMSWERRSEWHLDHFYPASKARDEAHLLELNHYTNLRPLWAIDNIRKGAKIPEEFL